MALQPIRGTRDILPDESRRHRLVTETARNISARYGYAEMSTPIMEVTEVFKRTLGDTTDVVTKEMYTFEDRSGGSVTLRPEGTAGVARALISGGLSQHLPLRYYYDGPMFRRERPQKGRYRQFHQIGIELLGEPGPAADVEVIAVGARILEMLGLKDKIKLEINSLGDTESRSSYRQVLVDYFGDHKGDLSEDSQTRLRKNPLRILDSKDEGDRKIVANAPVFSDSFTAEAKDFFAAVCEGLDDIDVAYTLNPRLVRGFDYYCLTAFEFVTDQLGAQGAVIAGGRYDGLVEVMGGPATPGVGFAGGIERMALLLDEDPVSSRPIAVVPVSAAQMREAIKLAESLRRAGLNIKLDLRGNLKKRLIRASRDNASVAVLIGEDELARGEATVRDLDSGDQQTVALDKLAADLLRCS